MAGKSRARRTDVDLRLDITSHHWGKPWTKHPALAEPSVLFRESTHCPISGSASVTGLRLYSAPKHCPACPVEPLVAKQWILAIRQRSFGVSSQSQRNRWQFITELCTIGTCGNSESSQMLRSDRLAVARWAIHVLALQVKAHGLQHPATPFEPAHWIWHTADIDLCLTEQVLARPDLQALESIFDVWVGARKQKVLSVSWTPESPWIPPVVRSFIAGDWLRELGYNPSEEDDQRTA